MLYQPKWLQNLVLNYSLKSKIYILLVTVQGIYNISIFRIQNSKVIFETLILIFKFCSGRCEEKVGRLELFVLISLVSDKQLRRDLVNIWSTRLLRDYISVLDFFLQKSFIKRWHPRPPNPQGFYESLFVLLPSTFFYCFLKKEVWKRVEHPPFMKVVHKKYSFLYRWLPY